MSSNNGASGIVSQDDIVESARRLLDLVTSSERHRGADDTNRDMIKFRRGLKGSSMWTVLTQRPDTVALLLPKEGAGNISPEVLLQRIIWPREDDDDDDDYSVDTRCRMTGYLRQFIVNATPTELTNLVKFWTGWEILPTSPSVEVVMGRYPTASTCLENLRIPGHYNDYKSFESDIQACLCSCQTGFGLV